MNGGSVDMPRPEHPRPDWMRETFLNLNGKWAFEFDDDDRGLQARWFEPAHRLAGSITVPFCYQSKASGIGQSDANHPILWYRRTFAVPTDMTGHSLLCFGAVDYRCAVWINGHQVGTHEGGYRPLSRDKRASRHIRTTQVQYGCGAHASRGRTVRLPANAAHPVEFNAEARHGLI